MTHRDTSDRRKRDWTRPFLVVAAVLTIAGTAATFAAAQISPSMSREIGQGANDYPEGEACASGIAIDVSPFGIVCTQFCADDTGCPENWGCKAVPEGGGTYAHLCFPRRVTVTE